MSTPASEGFGGTVVLTCHAWARILPVEAGQMSSSLRRFLAMQGAFPSHCNEAVLSGRTRKRDWPSQETVRCAYLA